MQSNRYIVDIKSDSNGHALTTYFIYSIVYDTMPPEVNQNFKLNQLVVFYSAEVQTYSGEPQDDMLK